MYTIHADSQLLFSSMSEDTERIVLSPRLTQGISKAGSLSFVLPPGNAMHGSLKKLKSIVTVEQDGVQIARGRVTETESDIYHQKSVYCDGEKSFLLDSLHAPYSYSGTVHGLFQKLINNHNAMVDEDRRFTVGTITAVDSGTTTEVETTSYANTSSELENRLLNVYGGYLRTRTAGSAHYIDWVDQYGEDNSQPVEFSVNLLDLTDKADAGNVFTCLIPLGASEIGDDGEYTDPISIASVNNGLNYIQDEEAVSMYGRIWKTCTWSHIDDPAQLLAKGREYLKTGVALETITLKAVDMHFTDGNIQPIRIGDRVRILSNPHGIDRIMTCSEIEIDLLNPENTLYTFGERPRTLTDNVVKAEEDVESLTGRGGGGGGRKSVQDEISDIIRWAKINVDETNAYIQLTAGELDKTNQRLSQAEIDIDGANAQITLAASRMDGIEGRVSSAEIRIDGAEAEIDLKVSKNGVISAINMTSESITISSNKINLSGYVTTSMLNAAVSDIGVSMADSITTNTLYVNSVGVLSTAVIREQNCTWDSTEVVTSITKPILAGKTIWYMDSSGNAQSLWVATGWSTQLSYKTEEIDYMSHT